MRNLARKKKEIHPNRVSTGGGGRGAAIGGGSVVVVLAVLLNRPLNAPISVPPQELTPFVRKGFTLVEWGGQGLGEGHGTGAHSTGGGARAPARPAGRGAGGSVQDRLA